VYHLENLSGFGLSESGGEEGEEF